MVLKSLKVFKEDEVLGHQLWDRLLFSSIQSVSQWITSGRDLRNRRKMVTCDVQGFGFGERGLLKIQVWHRVNLVCSR